MNPDKSNPEIKTTEPKPEATVSKPVVSACAEAKLTTKNAIKPKPEGEVKPEAKADKTKTATKPVAPKRKVGNAVIFTIAAIGILAGLIAAYIFGINGRRSRRCSNQSAILTCPPSTRTA